HREAVKHHRAGVGGDCTVVRPARDNEILTRIPRIAQVAAPSAFIADDGRFETAAVRTVERGDLGEVARFVKARKIELTIRDNRLRVGDRGELPSRRAPTEARIEV